MFEILTYTIEQRNRREWFWCWFCMIRNYFLPESGFAGWAGFFIIGGFFYLDNQIIPSAHHVHPFIQGIMIQTVFDSALINYY
jgi:hypothetical protein